VLEDLFMVDETLRSELLSLRETDLRAREELLAANQLGGPYHPRMEAVHVANAARLRELIAEHGWPAEDIAGKDGAEAAWLIAQHAIGEPQFMKQALQLLRACAEQGQVPLWHVAYLEDRIALYEGRPQRFGSQYIDDPRDGLPRPWTLADAEHVNDLRASVGLAPMPVIPPPGPDLPNEQQQENNSTRKWWLDWLASRGWNPG
jgi:hypothetical protein